MGLERVTSVLQNVRGNYDTDLLRDIIRATEEISGKRYGNDPENDISFRVIADHARAAAFVIADGVVPTNEGRGYVLRRIMRRALRHGRLLGFEGPFFSQVTESVDSALWPQRIPNWSNGRVMSLRWCGTKKNALPILWAKGWGCSNRKSKQFVRVAVRP